MCGIYGYSGTGADARILQLAAREAKKRGKHSFGTWCKTPNGIKDLRRAAAQAPSVREHYKVGRWSNYDVFDYTSDIPTTDIVNETHAAHVVVGHARYATCGSHFDTRESHPFLRGEVVLAHNGIFFESDDVEKKYGLVTTTGCDSEVLAVFCAMRVNEGSSLIDAVVDTIELCGSNAALMVASCDGSELVVARRGNPLAAIESRDGVYFSSTPWQKGVESIGDLRAYSLIDGEVKDWRPIKALSYKSSGYKGRTHQTMVGGVYKGG